MCDDTSKMDAVDEVFDKNATMDDQADDPMEDEDYNPEEDTMPRMPVKYNHQEQIRKVYDCCSAINIMCTNKKIIPTSSNNLNKPLLDHQIEAVQHIEALRRKNLNSLVSLQCGRGKTAKAIAIIKNLNKQTLVVAPTSLIKSWQQQLGKFWPQCTPIICGNDGASQVSLHSFFPGATIFWFGGCEEGATINGRRCSGCDH